MARQKKEEKFVTDVSTTAPSHKIFIGSSTVESETITAERSLSEKEVSDNIATRALYDYLRWQRARGRTEVRVDEVARALSVSIAQVERIAANLRKRGVKLED